MNKHYKNKLHIVLFVVIIFILLFPEYKVFAEIKSLYLEDNGETYTYNTEDDGTDGPEVNSIQYMLTGYGGKFLGATKNGKRFTDDDFTIDDKYGWRYYEQNGLKYVVFAAATHTYLTSTSPADHNYFFDKWKFSHIHYFKYFDVIKFKFKDTKSDSNEYLGIILDSCGVSTLPQHWWKKKKYSQINVLDLYFGSNGDVKGTTDNNNANALTGKEVFVTMDGIYSAEADQKDLSFLNFYMSVFVNLNHTIGDMFQRMIISSASENYVSDLVYAKEVIEGDEEIGFSLDNGETKGKYLQTIDIPNVVQDKSGTTTTCYTKETGIPVMPYDIYSICTNRIDNLDIDFLSVNTKNNSHIWNVLRNFVFTFTRITFFMTAAILIAMLIKRAITLVYSTYNDNPKEAAESKTIINIWIKAIIQLVGILIIIFITTKLYYNSIQQLLGEYTSNYIIRLNVTGVYSFNTNIIGLIKYKAMTANLTQAFGRSITYLIISLFSLLWYYIMGIRAILIGILSILAPLTIISVFKEKEVDKEKIGFNFKTWLKIYMTVMWFPLVIVIMLRLILRIT